MVSWMRTLRISQCFPGFRAFKKRSGTTSRRWAQKRLPFIMGMRARNQQATIEACSSVIQADSDHHRLAMAYFNRAGWYLKKGDVNRAASDLSKAIGLEPDFAAALTKRVKAMAESFRAELTPRRPNECL